MSISQPCFHGKELIGIMGVDLHMEDVVQDVTYYNQEINSYIFFINTDGKMLSHCKLVNTRPEIHMGFNFFPSEKNHVSFLWLFRVHYYASLIQSAYENKDTAYAHWYLAFWE